MDIERPDIKKKKRRRNILFIAIGVLVVAGVAFAVSRLKPAIPTVDASTIYPDTVKRGNLIRQVHGLGTLVPREDSIELIPAQTDATVVRIRVLPGAKVTPDTILMDLADPQLQQKCWTRSCFKEAQADFKSLQAHSAKHADGQEDRGRAVDADYTQDQLQAQTDKHSSSLASSLASPTTSQKAPPTS